MNRQTKRAMAKQEKAQKAPAPARRAAPPAQEKKKRTSLRTFMREVRVEMKKVQWPTRKETVSYTIVVLVTVATMTIFVYLLDTFFSHFVLNLFLKT